VNRPSCRLRTKHSINANHDEQFENYRQRAIKAESILRLFIKGNTKEASEKAIKFLNSISIETCGACGRMMPSRSVQCLCDGSFIST
jgi:hypothetical protein